jgi:hypothetical protein
MTSKAGLKIIGKFCKDRLKAEELLFLIQIQLLKMKNRICSPPKKELKKLPQKINRN